MPMTAVIWLPVYWQRSKRIVWGFLTVRLTGYWGLTGAGYRVVSELMGVALDVAIRG